MKNTKTYNGCTEEEVLFFCQYYDQVPQSVGSCIKYGDVPMAKAIMEYFNYPLSKRFKKLIK